MTHNRLFICGHIEGADCASGSRAVNEFITDNEALAKAHVEKYKGSWSEAGFYYPLPFQNNASTKKHEQ